MRRSTLLARRAWPQAGLVLTGFAPTPLAAAAPRQVLLDREFPRFEPEDKHPVTRHAITVRSFPSDMDAASSGFARIEEELPDAR
jgi:hypothetical protein